jgi:ribose transport system ATP-binding protein
MSQLTDQTMAASSGKHPGSPPRLQMRGIRKSFGATAALAGVDLEVAAGEVLALVGENGAGKSTLMKVLSGAHAADAGQMWLDGKPYHPRGPLHARRQGVAMIYQELSLTPHLSVMENILLGMEPRFGPVLRWRKLKSLAAEAMATVGRPEIPLDVPVSRLSIAEQQLVEIGRAVAVGCKVLVLDEPTSSLTQRDIALLFDLVRRLKAQGQAIVYISHFLEEVKSISDRYTVLRDGQSVGSGITAQATPAEIIAKMVGRTVEDLYPRSQRKVGDVLLDISSLSGQDKPQSATLQVRRGEVVGIAGLVGAGRSELLQTIFGLRAVRSGQVRVGAFRGHGHPVDRWRQGVGMVSEDRKTEGLALDLTIADNLTLSNLPVLVSPRKQQSQTRDWIGKLAIRCREPSQPVGALSGGNQQKVAIARLLYHGVDLLLLDEPTRGIDVGSKAQIYRLIDELACSGKAVLLVSSYLPELMGICDRIAVMCKGRLGAAKPVGQTTEHQIMLEATGGTDSAGAPAASAVPVQQ